MQRAGSGYELKALEGREGDVCGDPGNEGDD